MAKRRLRNFWCNSRYARDLYDPKIKRIFEIRWADFVIILFIHLNKHLDGVRSTLWKIFIMDYCLPLQMNTFGPKKFWFSCMGKKVPFWQFLKILKNSQNGTFLPMHENQKFFGPNAFIWSAKKVPFSDFIQNMSLALSMCLFTWIKVEK